MPRFTFEDEATSTAAPAAAGRYVFEDGPAAPAAPAPAGDDFSTSVRKFFDPGYGSNEPAGMGNVGRQMLKAASFLVPGGGARSLLASGALYGAGDSDADSASGVAWDAAKGAGGALVGGKVIQGVGNALTRATLWPVAQGAAIRAAMSAALDPRRPIVRLAEGAAGPVAAPVAAAATSAITTEPAVGQFAKAVAGPVTPSTSAQTLMGHGVRLTRGQQNPSSSVNQLEEAMTSSWPFGSKIKAQRGVGPSDLQVAALNQAIPPGMKPVPVGTEFTAAVESVDQGFRRAYGTVSDLPVYPAIHGPGGGPLQGTSRTPGAVEQAVDSVRRLQASQRDAIKGDVLDILTKLPPRKGAVGQVDAADMIEARSIIRGRARELWQDGTAESSAAAEAYEAAEGAITSALESQLPRSMVKTLQSTDRAYAKFKTVQKAIMAGRAQPGGFTPRQLANAASAGQSGVRVGSRDLGPLYDLGIAGADVFQRVSQPTGERMVTLADAGRFAPSWLQRPLQGAAIARGNTQAMSAVPVRVPVGITVPPLPMGAVPGLPQIPGSVPGAVLPAAYQELAAFAEYLRRIGLTRATAEDEEGR